MIELELTRERLRDAEARLLEAAREINDLKNALVNSAYMSEMMKQLPGALRLRTQETDALKQAVEDLNVQCKFWRQAAEHAVNGWNDLEDKVEAAREILDALEGNAFEARTLLGSSDEFAPPMQHPTTAIELPSAGPSKEFLRLVETETPIGKK